jgi:hypothetical protein
MTRAEVSRWYTPGGFSGGDLSDGLAGMFK